MHDPGLTNTLPLVQARYLIQLNAGIGIDETKPIQLLMNIYNGHDYLNDNAILKIKILVNKKFRIYYIIRISSNFERCCFLI